MTETTPIPALHDTSACRHAAADLLASRIFRAGQPLTIRLVGSGCAGLAWPDVISRIGAHGVGAALGLIFVDEAGDVGESAGYVLNDVRADPGTSIPVALYGTGSGAPIDCVILPARDPEVAVGARRQMRELLGMTGWSHRTVATVLHTSHVTVAKIASEGSSPRSSEVAERLAAVHACVRRLAPLAADAGALRAALESSVDEHGSTALKLLTSGDYARAYRFALGLLSPMPGGAMLQSRPNVSQLAATVPIPERTE